MVFMLGLTVGGPAVVYLSITTFLWKFSSWSLKKIPWYIYGFLKINPSFLVAIRANYKLVMLFFLQDVEILYLGEILRLKTSS